MEATSHGYLLQKCKFLFEILQQISTFFSNLQQTRSRHFDDMFCYRLHLLWPTASNWNFEYWRVRKENEIYWKNDFGNSDRPSWTIQPIRQGFENNGNHSCVALAQFNLGNKQKYFKNFLLQNFFHKSFKISFTKVSKFLSKNFQKFLSKLFFKRFFQKFFSKDSFKNFIQKLFQTIFKNFFQKLFKQFFKNFFKQFFKNCFQKKCSFQSLKYGIRRDWLIEFYSYNTKTGMRGETATLHDAVRYLPFVGMDFLRGEIPLDPTTDFRQSLK